MLPYARQSVSSLEVTEVSSTLYQRNGKPTLLKPLANARLALHNAIHRKFSFYLKM